MLYVHFPYCVHHCSYCDFNVVTPRRIPQRAFTDALLAELATRAGDLGAPTRSLYFGGGTPSLWAPDELARVVEAVRRAPGLEPDAEVTLEANPAEVTAERVAAWRRMGISRVSLGVQALHDELLTRIERQHGVERALEAIALVAEGGFRSYSLDFIFGLPGQTPAAWEADLERIAGLGAPHLSVYALTVEPRTTLARFVERGRVVVPDDAAQAEMLFTARRVLRAAGFEHYEISSYARPGHRAVHNSGYWQWRPYLGLGPGAHGFVPPVRWRNIARPAKWREAVLAGARPEAEVERLDEATLAFERVMTGLRSLVDGVELGADRPRFAEALEREAARGRVVLDGTRATLTEEGLRFMDDVLLGLVPD